MFHCTVIVITWFSAVIQGIVYFDSAVLGWRPVVSTWLADREQPESQCLLKYFEQIADSVVEFVLHKSGYVWTMVTLFKGVINLRLNCIHRLSARYSEVGLMETCLAYLSTLLKVSESWPCSNNCMVQSMCTQLSCVYTLRKNSSRFLMIMKNQCPHFHIEMCF